MLLAGGPKPARVAPMFKPARLGPALEAVGLGATLLLPLLLLHSRSGSEGAIDLVALAFLASSALNRRWAWLRQDWVLIGTAWWAWQLVCTLLPAAAPTAPRLLQAALMLRFLLFTAALQHQVLAAARARSWFLASLNLATAYVAAQTLLQFATGHNLFGAPRAPDGSLTGPFDKPRDGPTFIRMVFPPMLAAAGPLLARRSLPARLAASGVVLGAAAVIVLIGQRMPVLLLVLGLGVAALFLPRLRRIALVAVLASGALVAASAVISPPTFYRLVTKFSDQMEHFTSSHYGLIARRSLVIAGQHPLTGLGYDGYQIGCPDPATFHGWRWPADPSDTGEGAEMCTGHPHNHVLQALVDGGIPGALLFCALVLIWLRRLGRGLWRQPEPLRVGLFVAALIQEWPVASTSPIISLPIGGWFFLLLGFGLALSDAARR